MKLTQLISRVFFFFNVGQIRKNTLPLKCFKTLENVVLLKLDVAKTFVFLRFLDDPTMQNGVQKTFEFIAFLEGLPGCCKNL